MSLTFVYVRVEQEKNSTENLECFRGPSVWDFKDDLHEGKLDEAM